MCGFAAAAGAQTGAPLAEPINFLTLLQVGGGLIVVLLCLAGTVYLLRRFGSWRGGTGKLLTIIDAVPIGTRDRIVLLDVDGQRVLLGVSPGRIQPLLQLGAGGRPAFGNELATSIRALQGTGS